MPSLFAEQTIRNHLNGRYKEETSIQYVLAYSVVKKAMTKGKYFSLLPNKIMLSLFVKSKQPYMISDYFHILIVWIFKYPSLALNILSNAGSLRNVQQPKEKIL